RKMALTGTHWVRALASALATAKRLWPHASDYFEVYYQTLKLRFWGERAGEMVVDIDYESIKAMSGSGVYELRLDDEIGGHRNLRVIFFEPPKSWEPNFETPLPVLWVLDVVPKKRDDWTTNQIDTFWAKRAIVQDRFYE